ncbi:MAG: glycosyltransferase [Acidimicrobiales bacterium]
MDVPRSRNDVSSRVSLRRAGRVLVYASEGYTTHDRRFLAMAHSSGWEVHHLRVGGEGQALESRSVPDGVKVLEAPGALIDARSTGKERVQAFRQVVGGVGPSLIHAGPLPTVAALAVEAAVAPVVAMSWASDLLIDVHRSEEAQRLAVRSLVGATAVLVDCRTLAALAEGLGAAPDKITIVPWGVDLQDFSYVPLNDVEGPTRFISLRSFEPIYDVSTLLRAFAAARLRAGEDAMRLTLAGSGSEEASLRELAGRLGITEALRWAGRVPETEVGALLAAHHAHISTAHSDGTSISLLQAMAVGRPSIVSDLPANREWVEPGHSGWLFSPGDHEGLASRMIEVHTSRRHLEVVGGRCRLIVERSADWVKNGSVIAELYERSAQLGTIGPDERSARKNDRLGRTIGPEERSARPAATNEDDRGASSG